MNIKARAEEISEVVSQALHGSGVELDDVTAQQAGKRRLVRVFLARDLSDLPDEDRTSPVEPLTLDEVAEATRAVSAALDETDVMGEAAYTLEVSSAGLDRPLTTPAHFRRNVGRLLKVHLADGTTRTARLVGAGPDGISLDTDATGTGARGRDAADTADTPATELTWDEVTRAVVQVEFSRPDRKDS